MHEDNRPGLEVSGDACEDFGRIVGDGVKTPRAPQHKIESALGELLMECVVFQAHWRTKERGRYGTGVA